MKMLCFVTAGLLFCTTAAGAATPRWRTWSPQVFQQAQAEGKRVLVSFTAEWCTYCKKMERTTWRDPAVLREIEAAYVPVRVSDEQDPELARRYRGYGRPATLILDASGREILHKRGYLKPQWMLWMLQAVAAEPAPEATP